MTKWEYKSIDLGQVDEHDEMDLLNAAGKSGWQLVAFLPPMRAILSRPRVDTKPSARFRLRVRSR